MSPVRSRPRTWARRRRSPGRRRPAGAGCRRGTPLVGSNASARAPEPPVRRSAPRPRRGCRPARPSRCPETYRAGTPASRQTVSMTCAKSWQTPRADRVRLGRGGEHRGGVEGEVELGPQPRRTAPRPSSASSGGTAPQLRRPAPAAAGTGWSAASAAGAAGRSATRPAATRVGRRADPLHQRGQGELDRRPAPPAAPPRRSRCRPRPSRVAGRCAGRPDRPPRRAGPAGAGCRAGPGAARPAAAARRTRARRTRSGRPGAAGR